MAKYKDFIGFKFGNVHTSDLNLVVVSSSKRYDKNLLPEPQNYTTAVPGGDGDYYFGQTFKSKEFSVDIAFDDVSEQTFRKISQVFATDKLQDLVFDELPYKTYKAKVKKKPEFKFVCFTDKDTGQRVYKGEGNIDFICYFPLAYGFNKYVVRAADYYRCTMPETIITNSIEENPYTTKNKPKMLPGLIKDHYNTFYNMNTPWKGGYPTIEQVQAGELFFKDPTDNNTKTIIDVRGYWDNIPEWQGTAKLLVTPTLDYDRELIYLPQYNRLNYVNMDIGFNNDQGLIGSRILVYNPGDVPIDFELKLGHLFKRFRATEGDYKFRISRYNVQRLPIPCAVDWVDMKTVDLSEDEPYKYGNRYFKLLTKEKLSAKAIPKIENLKSAHPNHAYYVEPIPKEKLGHYIKLFHWQSYKLGLIPEEDYLKSINLANRYEELYNKCITDLERYELYWKTLKDGILSSYKEYYGLTDNREYLYEQMCENYLQHPPEYFKQDENFDHKYGQFDFNLSKLPCYITDDYFEITTKGLWDLSENDKKFLEPSQWGDDWSALDEYWQNVERRLPHDLFLDTEKRMLYNLSNPKWEISEFNEELKLGSDRIWDNYENFDNYYDYKPKKQIRNDSIVQGKWFKLPPGWSLIDISPVIDEKKWGGKLWQDGRPFSWGKPNLDEQQEFDRIYEIAVRDYLTNCCPEETKRQFGQADKSFSEYTLPEMEECLQFRRWYGVDEDNTADMAHNDKILQQWWTDEKGTTPLETRLVYFKQTLYHKMHEDAEYGFLKLLSSYWIAVNTNMSTGKLNEGKGIDSWWWYACNYIWANWPPVYWGYMDLLNEIQIKYTPLFY